MRRSLIALLAASALVASGPVVAQSRATAAPAAAESVRTGAAMDDESELRGRGILIPAIVITGLILLLLKLTDTFPFGDDQDSVSP